MRLLLEIGYQKILFGKGALISEIIASLDGIKAVDQIGYGDVKQFKILGDVSVQVQLINDDSVSLPDTIKQGDYEAFHNVAKQRDELSAKVQVLEKQLKEIKIAMDKEKV